MLGAHAETPAGRVSTGVVWRPLLRDPADDMVAEAGFAAGAQAIITHNRRDFVGVESLALAVLSPHELLKRTRP
jgi:hypothetical protein